MKMNQIKTAFPIGSKVKMANGQTVDVIGHEEAMMFGGVVELGVAVDVDGNKRVISPDFLTLAKSIERTSKENYQAVGTHDRRVIYCYARISTQTPVKTLPDLITGKVRDTVWLGEEYRRFISVGERQSFIDSFDTSTYQPKQLAKRGMNVVEKITGATVARTNPVIVRTKGVDMRKVVNK